ncbi:MAG TPA: hypothetical protein VL625_00590 [Patescibacteria group bacterium]|nr:hypothetical protein [Patescibacteria group bacterium]
MSGTADPLCVLFQLVGIIILTRGYDRKSVLASSACLILALLCKESAVAFPLLTMGLLFYQHEDQRSPKIYLKTWPFWAITAIYICIRIYLSGSSGFLDAFADPNAGFLNRLSIALATLPTYLRLIFWPSGLHVERTLLEHAGLSFAPILGGVAIIAISAALIILATSRTMPLAWGILWAAAAHIPESGILAPVNAPVCEHWLYFPSMGLILGTTQYLAGYLDGEGQKGIRRGVGIAIVAVTILLGAKTFLQNRIWLNAETLFQNAFANGETSDRAHINLGEYYLGLGEFDKAIAQFEIPVANQSRLSHWSELHFLLAAGYLHVDPNKPSVHEEIAEIARALPVAKRIPDAKRELDTALALNPGLFWANEMMAQIYAYQGENDEARKYLVRAGASAAREHVGH